MKITAIEPIVLRLDQVDTTRADGTQDAFVVKVHTDEGIVGVGEADTSPYVARTIVEMPSSHSVARGLGELLIGEDPRRVGELWERMYWASYHYGRAGVALHTISAIDIALWDIAGQAAGLPVSEMLGGRRTEAMPVYASEVMPESAEEVRAIARRAVAGGYRALKLGWGPLGRSLERDVELVAAARDELGEERTLMIDGGMAYSVKRAIQLVRELEPFRVHWLEEPLLAEDYDGYRRLSDAVPVRIAAGEADSGLRPYRALVELGHVDVLQPDLARCGGFTVARQIAEMAAATGTEVVPHCFSTGILVAASLHYTASMDGATFSELSVASSPLVNGLVTAPFELDDRGRVPVPAGPGLGIRLNDDLVERLRYR